MRHRSRREVRPSLSWLCDGITRASDSDDALHCFQASWPWWPLTKRPSWQRASWRRSREDEAGKRNESMSNVITCAEADDDDDDHDDDDDESRNEATYLLGSGLLGSRSRLLGDGSLLGRGLLGGGGGGGLLLGLGLGGELDLARGALGKDKGLLLGAAGDGLVDTRVEGGFGALGSLGVVGLDVLLDGGAADTGAGLGGVSKDGLLDHRLQTRRDGQHRRTRAKSDDGEQGKKG
ncbi:hypothetical protein L1887_50615 [Cichorium endivia]|nr:hypothetical protein L1887_50615 [Cichorium endivia]